MGSEAEGPPPVGLAFLGGIVAGVLAMGLGHVLSEHGKRAQPIGEVCDGFCFDYGPVLDFGDHTVRVCQVAEPLDDCFVYRVLSPEERQALADACKADAAEGCPKGQPGGGT